MSIPTSTSRKSSHTRPIEKMCGLSLTPSNVCPSLQRAINDDNHVTTTRKPESRNYQNQLVCAALTHPVDRHTLLHLLILNHVAVTLATSRAHRVARWPPRQCEFCSVRSECCPHDRDAAGRRPKLVESTMVGAISSSACSVLPKLLASTKMPFSPKRCNHYSQRSPSR